jgi:hypothetical protein
MFKPKLIRLIIYLVISIGLIVLLLNTPTESVPNKKKVKSTFQPIELPFEQKVDSTEKFEIEIDSLNEYIYLNDTLKLDELLSEIVVQKEKRPKLFLKITVHPRSKSVLLMNVIEFAKREKIKISITKN